MAEINGTEGNDSGDSGLFGTDGADTIRGFGGEDRLLGLGGDDLLEGGPGRDRNFGGDGNDTVITGDGDDFTNGGDGDDLIDASGMVEGFGGFTQPGLGTDTVIGSETLWDRGEGLDVGWDDLEGIDGLTVLINPDGSGTAMSGDGRVDDSFTFANFFVGSRDGDVITSAGESPDGNRFQGFAGSAGDDTIDGGADDIDALVYTFEQPEEEIQGVTVDFDTGTAIDTFGDTDSFTNIEIAEGTSKADVFRGTDSIRRVEFSGLAGDDTMEGGALVEGPGGFLFGVDLVSYSLDFTRGGEEAVEVDLIAGTATDGFGDTDTLVRIDGATGTSEDDVMRGSDTFNRFEGRGGNDLLEGRGGNDELVGGDGDDTLVGADGNDTLDGGSGADDMDGGEGDDIYIVDSVDDTISDSGGARDEVLTTIDFALEGTGIERVFAADGAGDIRLDGTAGADRLGGNDGSNILIGGGAIDDVSGGAGADFFVLAGNGAPAGLVIEDFSGEGGDGDVLVIDDRYLGLGDAGFDLRSLTIEEAFGLLDNGTASLAGGLLTFDTDGDGASDAGALIDTTLGIADVLIF